jgi:hypothetical protein
MAQRCEPTAISPQLAGALIATDAHDDLIGAGAIRMATAKALCQSTTSRSSALPQPP